MDIKKLQTLVIDALEDVKAQDIVMFDTVHLTSLFDRIVVASGTSNRQTKALAASVRDKIKDNGGDIVGMEGEDTGEWVLVDLGDIIVHIMQPAIRAYYRLEEIWGDKPMKLGAVKRKSSPEAAQAAEAAPKQSRHLTSTKEAVVVKPVIEKKEKKAPTKKAVEAAAAKKAPKAKKEAAPVGKTVKIAPSKTSTAAVKALKALPPKRKVAKPAAAADAAPVKKVIKRIAKPSAE